MPYAETEAARAETSKSSILMVDAMVSVVEPGRFRVV